MCQVGCACLEEQSIQNASCNAFFLSHTPPIWEEWGGLKTEVHLRVQCVCRSGSSVSRLSSLHAPIKFVPRSDLSVLMGPLIAVNCLRPLMKIAVVMVSRTSICTALVLKQVNMAAHRLLSAWPPLVLRAVTIHGPKTFTLAMMTVCLLVTLTSSVPPVYL